MALRVTSMATLPPPMTHTFCPVKSGISSSPMPAQQLHGGDDALAVLPLNPSFFVGMGADGDVQTVMLLPELVKGDDPVPPCTPVWTSIPRDRMESISASSFSRGRR